MAAEAMVVCLVVPGKMAGSVAQVDGLQGPTYLEQIPWNLVVR